MEAGRLNQRVEVQSASESRNAAGDVDQTWSTDNFRWAQIEPLKGRELFEAQQAKSDVTHKIRLRFYDGLTGRNRIKMGSRIFNIVGAPINSSERDRETVVMAAEAV